MNDAPVRRVSLRRKRKSCEAVTEIPEQKRVSPSPDKSDYANKYVTENKQKNKVETRSKGKVLAVKPEITTNEKEVTEVRKKSPRTTEEDTVRDIQEAQSTPKSRGLSNSMASTCSILSSTLMHNSPDMPFYSSQLGATQECEVVWDCNSPGFSKEDLKKMYNNDSGSPSPVAAPIPPRALFPLGKKNKDSSMKKKNSNYAAQVTAQLDALLLKISSSEKTESKPSSEDSSLSEDRKLDPGLPCPLKEMASQPFIVDEVESSFGEQDTQSVRNLSIIEFSEDLFAEEGGHVAPSDIPVIEKESNSTSEGLSGKNEGCQVPLEYSAEVLKKWLPEDVNKKVEEKEVLKESSDLSTDEFDDDLFNESVIKSTQALEEAFLGEKHCDDLQVVEEVAGLGRNDDFKEYISPVVGKPRKPSTEINYMNTKVENRSSKLSSSTNDTTETLPAYSRSCIQKSPHAKNNQLTGVHRFSKAVSSNNSISGSRYNSQFKFENRDVSEEKSDGKGLKCDSMGSESSSDTKNYDGLGVRRNSELSSNYMTSRVGSVGHENNIASRVDSHKQNDNSYRPRKDSLGHKTNCLESRNDVSGLKNNSLGSGCNNLGFQSALVLTKREQPHNKSSSQNEIKRGSDVNKVGLPRSRSSHCFQVSTSSDLEPRNLRRTNSSEHSVKVDLNDAVFGEDFDDSFFDTILSTLPENVELMTSEKSALVTGIMPSAHIGPAQKTNYKMGSAKKCSNEADVLVKSKTSSSVKLVKSKQNHPQSSGASLAESFGDDDLFQDDVLNIIDQVESQYASQPPSQLKCSQDEIRQKKEEAKRRRQEKMKKKHGYYFPVC